MLGAIELLLEDAQAGAGRGLLIEAHAGMGKTRLHEAALDSARRRRMRVLRAAGAELERNIAFGVAAQLLSSQLAELSPAQRNSLLARAPERVQALAGARESMEPSEGADLALSHGLFTLLATAQPRPALIAIDDLHWCDTASLEFVLYVLHRLEELPVAVLMTRRPGVAESAADVLDLIAADPHVEVQTLSPLGSQATGRLARQTLGLRADAAVIDACHGVTAGNPFYIHALLLALSEERTMGSEELARMALELAPDAVTRTVRVRVGRLGPAAGALARAVAILGDDVELRHAAALAELSIEHASEAADRLAAVEILLAREPLRFVHPLVRQAVIDDIPASEQASRHLDAARLLHAEGASAERVAAHLLVGRAQGDPWAVEQLRAAARDARRHGASQSAVGYLRRAVEEPPAAELRGEVLAELGAAEAAAGLHEAVGHLAEAAADLRDPRRRAELALARGHALFDQGEHALAAKAFDEGLAELPTDPTDPDELELHDQLQTGFVLTAGMVASLQPRAIERSTEMLKRAPDVPQTQGQRLLLAHAAAQASSSGQPAGEVFELCERAWDGGALLEHGTAQGFGWFMVHSVLCTIGALEQAMEIADAAVYDARRRAWPLAFATTSLARAIPQLWQGRVDGALADLELARDARRYGWRQYSRSAAAFYALSLIEKGNLAGAQAVLDEDGPVTEGTDLEDAHRAYCLAELRLAEGRPGDALELALRSGRIVERNVQFFGFAMWRTCAAQAMLALGDRDSALELAREAWERADRTRILHQRIRTLRVLGICEQGDEGLERLRAAAALGEANPPRLETIRALVDLGAALRRANHRSAAREPLHRAVELAKRGGATALHDQARIELTATGARPRREALLSGPESLTPSERRIAELAAAGQSNREIASALFVTPKTVEYHLRNAYRKLDIESRRELGRVLVA